MATTSRSRLSVLLFACLGLLLSLATTRTLAQIVPTSSEDPLSGSSFVTSAFTPSTTFTPTTTFNQAGSRTPTSVVGVGPSLTTNSYTFSYDIPLSTVSGTDLANLYSSLAANNSPTAATSALTPNPSNLQIVVDAPDGTYSMSTNSAGSVTAVFIAGAMPHSYNFSPVLAIVAAVIGGAGAVLL